MIIFRTQASEEIGFGHIKRSAYLASLIKKNNKIIFVLKKNKVAVNFIKERGFSYALTSEINSIDWSSVDGVIFDIRIIESFDNDIVKIAEQNKIKTAQITDLGLSQLDTDILVNGSISTIEPIIKTEKCLNGLQYSILHHKFTHFNRIKKKYRKNAKNILISLGGGVKYRQLRDLIDFLYRYNYNLKITGGFYLKRSAKKILKRLFPKIKFVGHIESLARPLYEADIAIVTAGITAYEAASAGTPALYFYYNKEQEHIADKLEKVGAGLKISDIKNMDKAKLKHQLDELSLEKRTLIGNKAKKLNNGTGVYKIIEKLSEIAFIKNE